MDIQRFSLAVLEDADMDLVWNDLSKLSETQMIGTNIFEKNIFFSLAKNVRQS